MPILGALDPFASFELEEFAFDIILRIEQPPRFAGSGASCIVEKQQGAIESRGLFAPLPICQSHDLRTIGGCALIAEQYGLSCIMFATRLPMCEEFLRESFPHSFVERRSLASVFGDHKQSLPLPHRGAGDLGQDLIYRLVTGEVKAYSQLSRTKVSIRRGP